MAVFITTPLDTPYGGMYTDGYATALSVMPWEKSSETLAKNPKLEGILVHSDAKYFQTPDAPMTLFT